MTLDEQALIERATAGDKKAFGEIVRRYQNRIFAFVMRMTHNRDTALDLTQDTLLAAYRNLDGFREEATFSTWLFQIAANKTINSLKRSARETALDDVDTVNLASDHPDTRYIQKERERLVARAIIGLPEKQRLAFGLRYYEHMKFEEIARVMNVSVSAAKTDFSEALKKLKTRLSQS